MGPTVQWGLAICRGEGAGVGVTNCLLLGGGDVDFEIKTGLGGGVADKMTDSPKNCPAPPLPHLPADK